MWFVIIFLFLLIIFWVGIIFIVFNDCVILVVIVDLDKFICILVELINVENKDIWEIFLDLFVDSCEDILLLGLVLMLEVIVVLVEIRNVLIEVKVM